MNKWNKVTLGDIIDINTSSYSVKEDWTVVNYLDTGNITKNVIDEIQHIKLKEENLPSRARRKVKFNSILYSTVRPNQKHYGIIKSDIANLLVSTGFAVIDVDQRFADADFIYFLLTQDDVIKNFHSIAEQSTSTYPAIKPSDIENLEIILPPLDTQKRIATVLTGLSKKISCNIEINDNLQQQAFALFEQLLINAGDVECSVADIAHLNPKRALAKNQEAKCIEMSQLSTSGAFPSGWEKRPFTGGMRFSNGDTLLARITPCLENGKAAFIDFLDTLEVAFGSTEYIVLASKGEVPPEFLYCLARYPAFSDYAVKNMNGSSGRQRVSAETIGQFKLPRPSTNELKRFGNAVSSLFLKMRFNSLENTCLSSLRDSLLPKLISGELDVSELDI